VVSHMNSKIDSLVDVLDGWISVDYNAVQIISFC
jgi:hypothetical protein